MNTTATWWALPKWITDAIQPKGKTSISFKAYKKGENWYFDAPLLLTWNEGLACTDQLDELADGSDSIWITASTEPIEDAAMKIWYEGDDAWDQTASIYIDPKGKTIWLCGWLLWYFGYKPEYLWIAKG